MQTCSFSMSATASAFPTSSSSPPPPSLSNISLDYLSLTTINHFSIKAKPIKPPKLRTHFSSPSLFSTPLVFSGPRAVAAFEDGASSETIQDEEDDDGEDGQPIEAVVDETAEEEESGDVDGDEEGVESLASEERRLYVGNLPYSMTSTQLQDVFAEAGRVTSVEIIYDKVTDRSRGFAFVTMGSVEEAKEAIRMFEGSQVGGRTMKVNFPEVPKGGEREVMGPKIKSSYQGFIDTPHKIYAGNLSWALTSEGLKEAFADQPGLLSAKVIYERGSGRSRGFGFVTFASAEEVDSALTAMNGVEVEGRPMRLNLADRRAPTSSSPVAESNSENKVESYSGNDGEGNSENELESSDVLSSASI